MSTVKKNQWQQLSDEDVMEQFQAGEEMAYNVLVQRYRNRIYHFVYRYTRNYQDSEDLTQDTLVRLYRCRLSYKRIARFSTWLYTIAGNLMKSHYKKKQRMQAVSIYGQDAEGGNQPYDPADPQPCVDDSVHATILLERVEQALHEMPEEFSSLIILRDIQQKSYEEVVDISGLPMGTVKSRINRGRARLAGMIREYEHV